MKSIVAYLQRLFFGEFVCSPLYSQEQLEVLAEAIELYLLDQRKGTVVPLYSMSETHFGLEPYVAGTVWRFFERVDTVPAVFRWPWPRNVAKSALPVNPAVTQKL